MKIYDNPNKRMVISVPFHESYEFQHNSRLNRTHTEKNVVKGNDPLFFFLRIYGLF